MKRPFWVQHSFWVQWHEKDRKELVTISATSEQKAWELVRERFEDDDVEITERGSK